MTAKDVYELGMKGEINIHPLLYKLRAANDGALRDVQSPDTKYYIWTTKLIKKLKPKQVVELGGAMGVWALCVLHTLLEDSKLYSITLEEHGLEFEYVVDKYPNFVPIVGDDLDMDNWDGVDLEKTDLWFFDALHTADHLTKELDLYSKYFKKGAIILFDDVHSFGLEPVWTDIKSGKWGKMDCYDSDLHHSGYGVCIYEA